MSSRDSCGLDLIQLQQPLFLPGKSLCSSPAWLVREASGRQRRPCNTGCATDVPASECGSANLASRELPGTLLFAARGGMTYRG